MAHSARTRTLQSGTTTNLEVDHKVGIIPSGTATRGVDFFVPGDTDACSIISFSANASGNDFTQSCQLAINASAAGKTTVLTLADSADNLMQEGSFSTTFSPATHTVTVVAP